MYAFALTIVNVLVRRAARYFVGALLPRNKISRKKQRAISK